MSGTSNAVGMHALMLARMAPLLAGCNEPTAATAAAKPPEPEVRHLHRNVAGSRHRSGIARTDRADPGFGRSHAGLRHRRRTSVPAGNRGDGRRSAVPDRSQAVRGGTAGERGRAGQGDGCARSRLAACAAHRDADHPARGARGPKRKGHRGSAPGRGRGRQPQGRRRPRETQSRLRDDPCADQRRRRRGAGQRRRAGGAERDHRVSPRSSNSIRSTPTSPNRSRR